MFTETVPNADRKPQTAYFIRFGVENLRFPVPNATANRKSAEKICGRARRDAIWSTYSVDAIFWHKLPLRQYRRVAVDVAGPHRPDMAADR